MFEFACVCACLSVCVVCVCLCVFVVCVCCVGGCVRACVRVGEYTCMRVTSQLNAIFTTIPVASQFQSNLLTIDTYNEWTWPDQNDALPVTAWQKKED